MRDHYLQRGGLAPLKGPITSKRLRTEPRHRRRRSKGGGETKTTSKKLDTGSTWYIGRGSCGDGK